MNHGTPAPAATRPDDYLLGRREAAIAFVLTLSLMVFDYADRQVIVSLFPYLKAEWSLSDKQLGALVSVVSGTVALGCIPIALIADRFSRVKSIVVMAIVWSLATISCMFTRRYESLLAARALVGLGEAGYGSVGAALIASHFPARMRGTVLAAFFASASVGSVLGVILGGAIATRWGWQAAFGVVGIPGLLLALLFLRVRDYRTLVAPRPARGTTSANGGSWRLVASLLHTSTIRWVCLGAAAQLIVVSAIWAWLPSFLNRYHGMAPDHAAVRAAIVVLLGAAGSLVWGRVVDHAGATQPRRKLTVLAGLCVLSSLCAWLAFGSTGSLAPTAPGTQFALIAVTGFLLTCTVGPVSAIVIDVVNPAIRSTGASVLSLFQNLLGLAAGPFIGGVLSDQYGLSTALTIIPIFGCLAALLFMYAARNYETDAMQAAETTAITA